MGLGRVRAKDVGNRQAGVYAKLASLSHRDVGPLIFFVRIFCPK